MFVAQPKRLFAHPAAPIPQERADVDVQEGPDVDDREGPDTERDDDMDMDVAELEQDDLKGFHNNAAFHDVDMDRVEDVKEDLHEVADVTDPPVSQ
jgi:hypothetical protein